MNCLYLGRLLPIVNRDYFIIVIKSGFTLPMIKLNTTIPYKWPLLIFGILLLLFQHSHAVGQQMYRLGLLETIELAKKQSPDGIVATTKYKGAYWRYRSFRADFLPSLTLNGTLPDLNRSFFKVTKPDGRDSFVYRSLSNSSANLLLSQQVGLTGGTIFVNSNLARLDIFGNGPSTSYNAIPVSIGINQPLNIFNGYRWLTRIEPVYFKLAKRQYAEDIENLSLQAVDLFFDVLSAQSNVEISQLNKKNIDTVYQIGQGRYNLGKIAENDLLQLELGSLNAGLEVQQARITLNASVARLKSFLALNAKDSIALILPADPDTIKVDMATAWLNAGQYSSATLDYERQSLEAARDLAQARGNNRIKGNLVGQFGLSSTGANSASYYTNPKDQEQLTLGVTMPLLTWGKSKGAIEMARANQKLVETNIRKSKTDFEQQVYLQTAQFNLQSQQLTISRKASEVGHRRYFIAKQRYLLGKISITDLSIAQNERDAASRSFISVLRTSWDSYYQLRKITLYDFKKQKPLEELISLP